jgi:hypothetical protein
MHSETATTIDSGFQITPVQAGLEIDLRSDQHPTIVAGWNDSKLELKADATHFGFVHSGHAQLASASGCFNLSAGMYFSLPDEARIEGTGAGFVSSIQGFTGFFQIGGPIEQTGVCDTSMVARIRC